MDIEGMGEYEIPAEAMEQIKDPHALKRQIDEGKTLQEIFGYDDATMVKFYLCAKNLFERQEWKKSADAFLFLTSLNPYISSYWLGLGMSEQLRGKFQGALLAYAMAILTDVENPLPHYQSAKCYQSMGEMQNGIFSLELAVECAKRKPEYSNILEAAEEMLKAQQP